MINLRFLNTFAVLLFMTFAGRSYACSDASLEVYIDVVRLNADNSSVCMTHQGDQFLYVNGQGIGFYNDGNTKSVCESTDTENIKSIWKTRWYGCIDKSLINASKPNQFSLSICTSDGSGGCSSSTYVNRSYGLSVVTERGQSRSLIVSNLNGVGAQVNQTCTIGSQGSGSTCLNQIFTEDILEQTKADVVALEGETNQLKIAFAAAEGEFNSAKAAYDAALAALNKPVDQLTPADFAVFDKASRYYSEARQKYDDFSAEVTKKEQDLQDRLQKLKNAATEALSGYGIDPKSKETYDWAVAVVLPPIEVNPLPGETPLPAAENIFKVIADNTIPALNLSWSKQDRKRFLELVVAWTVTSSSLLENYKERTEISATELAIYSEQIKRVEDFVYGVNAADGYLSRSQWFKDSVVPVNLQNALDDMLANNPKDPVALLLKQRLAIAPGKNSQVDEKTFALIVFSYSLVSYFQEFRKIYDAALAQGYQPPPAVPPSGGRDSLFAGYSWDALTRANFANQKAIQELKQLGAMGIDLYVSTSLASPLVSLCRLVSGNSQCRFDRGNDLSTFDYVLSAFESLALIAPVAAALEPLKGLSIGGKVFAVSEQILSAIEKIKSGALQLGLNAAQETFDFAVLLFKAGIKTSEDLITYAKYLKNGSSIREYLKIARSIEPMEKIALKVKVLPELPGEFYDARMINPYVGEATEDFYVVRTYGTYGVDEVPSIGGIPQSGAPKLGNFWGNRLYKDKQSFYSGCVVFPEWNGGKRIVLLKVKKGTKVVIGQGRGQSLSPSQTFDGTVKSIAGSSDWQISFPGDSTWFAQNPGKSWVEKLSQDGKVEVLSDVSTGWN